MDKTIYARWIWANAWSELVGLGGTLALGFLVFSALDQSKATVVIAGALFAVVMGAGLEGGIVGYAQGRVLRSALPTLHVSTWVLATAIGAGTAWLMGMIPSTVMTLMAAPGEGMPGGGVPEGLAMIALAGAMGLVLGPVLGIPQYVVLRRLVSKAGLWIPANALAWAAGMIVVFLGSGTLPVDASAAQIMATVGLACMGAGAAVGVVHGLFLLWILRKNGRLTSPVAVGS